MKSCESCNPVGQHLLAEDDDQAASLNIEDKCAVLFLQLVFAAVESSACHGQVVGVARRHGV